MSFYHSDIESLPAPVLEKIIRIPEELTWSAVFSSF
jgi:hypothetical protein